MKIGFVWDAAAALGPLQALQDPRLARKVALAAAQDYHTTILDWIAAGNSFTPRNGGAGAEGSIGWRPDGDGAVVYAGIGEDGKVFPHAVYLEYGTGIHGPKAADYAGLGGYVIKPKPGRRALKIPIDGGYHLGPNRDVYRRQVIHPGIEPSPYFFADLDRREGLMLDAALGVLATALDGR